jgi:ribosomal protein L19E
MPNSLRCKLSKLRFQGKITQDEYKELIEKLEGHDEELKKQYERGFKDGIRYGVEQTKLD